MTNGRETGSPIPVLNGFRAYAILAIVLFHLLSFASPGSEYGPAVWMVLGGHLDTFFIASGCALFLPVVLQGELDVGTFARKRFARIVPSYWLTLTLILILIAATGDPFPSPTEMAVQYTALQTPARLIEVGMPIGFGMDQALWLMSIIVGLYVLLAVAWRPYLRHPLIGLAIAAAITIAWRLAAVHLTGVFEEIEGHSVPGWFMARFVGDQLPSFVFSFGLGMTCAWAYVRFAKPRPRKQLERIALWAAPFALAAFVGCAYAYAELSMGDGAAGGATARNSVVLIIAMPLARAAAMAVIAFGPALSSWLFVNRLSESLSKATYGVYLIHMVIAIYVGERLLDLPQDGTIGTIALWCAVVVPPSLAFGYLTERLVERPVRAWARREGGVARRRSEPRAQSAPLPRPARSTAD